MFQFCLFMPVIRYAQAIQDANVPPLLADITRDLDRRLSILSEIGQNWNAVTMQQVPTDVSFFTTTLNEWSINLFLLPINQNLQFSNQTSAVRLAFPRLFPVHRVISRFAATKLHVRHRSMSVVTLLPPTAKIRKLSVLVSHSSRYLEGKSRYKLREICDKVRDICSKFSLVHGAFFYKCLEICV